MDIANDLFYTLLVLVSTRRVLVSLKKVSQLDFAGSIKKGRGVESQSRKSNATKGFF